MGKFANIEIKIKIYLKNKNKIKQNKPAGDRLSQNSGADYVF